MKIVRSVKELQRLSDSWRGRGLKIGLVPTMGYFHEGHLSLMRAAKESSDRVITTLFVNPTQFGPNEDLDAYPRAFESDRGMAEKEGVDVLFAPSVRDMYGENYQTNVIVQKLSKGLCGAGRPGHFDGVATVVTKLFNIAKPHVAVFGQKDFQQLAMIRQMALDLNYEIEIIGHPIVREPDGLAMSSRNKYLNKKERKIASCLFEAITNAQELFSENSYSFQAKAIQSAARQIIERHPECVVEYVTVVNKTTLNPVDVAERDSMIILAVKVSNKVRLIDNSPLVVSGN